MTDFRRLFKNRFYTASVIAALILLLASMVVLLAAFQTRPQGFFPFVLQTATPVSDDIVIRGSARFDKDSYVIGEPATYEIRLIWDNEQVTPDLETFRNGIGFFPFNREGINERQQDLGDGLKQYTLRFSLQAVDVAPSSTHTLPPPTVYFEDSENSSGELQAYRITAPRVHIGSYYPEDVSRVPLLDYKGAIADPAGLRQAYMLFICLVFVALAGGLVWNFGRVRKIITLSEPERLWREFQALKGGGHGNRDYLIGAELIFTDLLQARINMSPARFWAGSEPDEEVWKDEVERGRALFYQAYLEAEPGTDLIVGVNDLLDTLFPQLVEEERLKTEQIPSFTDRLKQQPLIITSCSIMVIIAVIAFVLALQPGFWISADVLAYNDVVSMRKDGKSIERQYEYATGLVERVNDDRIKAAALYNAGIMAAEPGLTGQDINEQAAILEVMFQEEKVFLDALMHSLGMDDPFLLVSIIRDSLRFLTQGEAALKAAVRIAPHDEDIRRNLELVQKRKQAYAETIQELLQQGEDDSGMGELQRQSLMDLEMFMQMEMPDEYAELEEGKDDKDYFILEGF